MHKVLHEADHCTRLLGKLWVAAQSVRCGLLCSIKLFFISIRRRMCCERMNFGRSKADMTPMTPLSFYFRFCSVLPIIGERTYTFFIDVQIRTQIAHTIPFLSINMRFAPALELCIGQELNSILSRQRAHMVSRCVLIGWNHQSA